MNNEQMNASIYRDMHLLDELAQRPGTTQRELAKRIGVALGLTNLMLRRLVKKGYVKITQTQRNRLRYLITPTGILEKSRLTYEFIQYSLQLYGRIRYFLREQLALLAQAGHRRVLLYGRGELAEIAFLVIQEIGLELVGIVDEIPAPGPFLGYPILPLSQVPPSTYDCIIMSSIRPEDSAIGRLVALGIARERMILLPLPGGQPTAPPLEAVVSVP